MPRARRRSHGRSSSDSERDLRRIRWAGRCRDFAPPNGVGTAATPRKSWTPPPTAGRMTLRPPPSGDDGTDTTDTPTHGTDTTDTQTHGRPISPPLPPTPTSCMKGARAAAAASSVLRGRRRRSRSPPAMRRRAAAPGGTGFSPSPPWAGQCISPRTPERGAQLSGDSAALELSPPTDSAHSCFSPRLLTRRLPPSVSSRTRDEEQECRRLVQQREAEYRMLHVRRLVRGLGRAGMGRRGPVGDLRPAAERSDRAVLQQLRSDAAAALRRAETAEAQLRDVNAQLDTTKAALRRAEAAADELRCPAADGTELEAARAALRQAEADAKRRTLVENALQAQLVRESSDRRRLTEELREAKRGAAAREVDRDAALAAARAAAASAADSSEQLRSLRTELAAERAARERAEGHLRASDCDAALAEGLAEAERVLRVGEREARRLEMRAVRAERELMLRPIGIQTPAQPGTGDGRSGRTHDVARPLPTAPSSDTDSTVCVNARAVRGEALTPTSAPDSRDPPASRCSPTPGCSQCPLTSPRRSHRPVPACDPCGSTGSVSAHAARLSPRSGRQQSPLRSPRPVACRTPSPTCSGRGARHWGRPDVERPAAPDSSSCDDSANSDVLRAPRAAPAGVLADASNRPAPFTSTETQHSFRGFRLMVEDIKRRHMKRQQQRMQEAGSAQRPTTEAKTEPLWRRASKPGDEVFAAPEP
eukprot:TRINITY_DN23449_c0_g1_i1.p1 TRINITY_DN23449_c0_g1~~TRINITY_DN23449_c0_g1_i1.p1  ORF type:complete len:707 (+),score=273.87 TRINITY_DN23449_c0_g1_i1:63-2183(+)